MASYSMDDIAAGNYREVDPPRVRCTKCNKLIPLRWLERVAHTLRCRQ